MSNAGSFRIITNAGRADSTIMAMELLTEQITSIKCSKEADIQKAIMMARQQNKIYEPEAGATMPTLKEIEETHILFMNAHFKPFASLAYEYQQVRAMGGNFQFGQTIQFSIPQFGDFWSDCALHIKIDTISLTAGVVPALPANSLAGAGTATYVITQYRYVNSAGTTLTPGAAVSDYVYWSDFPGWRLCKKTTFTINNSNMDEYYALDYIFENALKTLPHKKDALYRLVGQEVPVEAKTIPLTVLGVSGALDTSRRLGYILNGYQTPKATQPQLEMWVPLLFWFKDFNLSFPSVAVPYGQRFINVELEAAANMMYRTYGDLYLETAVHTVALTGVDAGPILSTSVSVTRAQTYASAGGTTITAPSILTFEMYVNNIFVTPEIHDIFMKRVAFNLVRVHRRQTDTVNTASDNKQLTQFKWPIEYMFFGLMPVLNDASGTNWWKFTYNVDQVSKIKSYSTSILSSALPTANSLVNACTNDVETMTYQLNARTVDTLKLTAHGIDMYVQLNSEFFTQYLPFNYGNLQINTTGNYGMHFIPFALYPGVYQPSGHLNVSRARELYLYYWSSLVGSVVPSAYFICSGCAINFLLVSEGSAVLRMST
jgi:hypothetical protein